MKIRNKHRCSGVVAIPLVMGLGGQMLGGWLAGSVGAIIGGMAGAYIGSMLFPQKSETEMQSLPKVGSYRAQTTLSGTAIPFVRGTCRLSGNVVYLGKLKPYHVVTSSSGGGGGKGFGGGGGDDVVTTETRYKRSFFIGICEGVATIGKAWKGKKRIPLSHFTAFDGDGNEGLAEVVGKEFAHWKHLCGAWFENYDLGPSTSIPMFTFEVNCKSTFKFGDIIAGGDYYGTTGSCVESYDVLGKYSHKMITQAITSIKEIKIKRFPDNENYCISFSTIAGWVRVYKVKMDGSAVWQFENSLGSSCPIYIDSGGNIYTGIYYAGTSNIQKRSSNDGSIIWQKLTSNFSITGITPGTDSIYALADINKVYRLKSSDGTILWSSPQISSLRGTLRKDVNFLYTFGKYGAHSYLWCLSHDETTYPGTQLNYIFNDFSPAGLQVLSGTPPYMSFIFVGINGVNNSVAKVGLKYTPMVGFSFELLKTYLINSTIYDIQLDLDGELLVCHDRGTDESGKIGHITKLSNNLDFHDIIDCENDRSGFVRTVERGLGTPIGGETDYTTVNPLDFVYDILTDKRVGGGIDPTLLDMTSLVNARQYCKDNNISIAMSLDSQQPLTDWLDLLNSHYHGYMRMG